MLERRAGLTLTAVALPFVTGIFTSVSLFSQTEPDNDAYVRCASRPCSPVHHDMHSKLSSSPPRSSPARLGPSYVLKKGNAEGACWEQRGVRRGAGVHLQEREGMCHDS